MNIGLDYDDTYTRHPEMWDKVISVMQSFGHTVYVVTWRTEGESDVVYRKLASKVRGGVHPTGRKAKAKFMADKGVIIHVWVDDFPAAIIRDMEPL